jgi:hypothetical protein
MDRLFRSPAPPIAKPNLYICQSQPQRLAANPSLRSASWIEASRVSEIGVVYRSQLQEHFCNSSTLIRSGRSEWSRSDDVYGVYALSLSPGFMVGDSLLVFIDDCEDLLRWRQVGSR